MGIFAWKNKSKDASPTPSPRKFFSKLASTPVVEANWVGSPKAAAMDYPEDTILAPPAKPFTGDIFGASTVNLVVSAGPAESPIYRDSTKLQQLRDNLEALRINGRGLQTAAQDSQVMTDLINITNEALRLKEVQMTAYGHKQNVELYASFVNSVLQTLDAQAAQGSINESDALDQIYNSICKGVDLVEQCGKPGWFSRMVRSQHLVSSDFARIHKEALDVFYVHDWDKCQGLAGLTDDSLENADYRDIGGDAITVLRKLGNNNLDTGVKRIKTDVTARKLVAETIDVAPEDLMMEIIFDLDAAEVVTMPDGPLRDLECRRMFQPYASHSTDEICYDDFYQMMDDMSLLDGYTTEQRGPVVRTAFVSADHDYDGFVNFQEFRAYYTKIPISMGQMQLRLQSTLRTERKLRERFVQFAQFGTHRKNSENLDAVAEPALGQGQFVKLCKDCNLLGHDLTKEQVDVVFARVKGKDRKNINFPRFVGALSYLAAISGRTLTIMVDKLLSASPSIQGTTINNFVRLHDDKTTHSGVYGRGGPDLRSTNVQFQSMVARPSGTPRGGPATKSPIPAVKPGPTKAHSPRLNVASRARNGTSDCLTPGRGAKVVAPSSTEKAPLAKYTPTSTTPKGPNLSTAARAEARAVAMKSAQSLQDAHSSQTKYKGSPAKKPTNAKKPAPKEASKPPVKRQLVVEVPAEEPVVQATNDLKALNMTPIESSIEVEHAPTMDDIYASIMQQENAAIADDDDEEEEAVAVVEECVTAVVAEDEAKIEEPADEVVIEPLRELADDEIKANILKVFTGFAATELYQESEPVLDEDGFRKLIDVTGLGDCGVGLPASSVLSIFDIASNAVTNLMSFEHFNRSLQLIAARTAASVEDLEKHLATCEFARTSKKTVVVAIAEEEVDVAVAEEEPIVAEEEATAEEVVAVEETSDDAAVEEPVAEEEEEEAVATEEQVVSATASDNGDAESIVSVPTEEGSVKDEEVEAETMDVVDVETAPEVEVTN